jgi:hypothetical protein
MESKEKIEMIESLENDEKYAQFMAKKFKKPVWLMRVEWWFHRF